MDTSTLERRPTRLDTPCIEWQGTTNDRGYGIRSVNGRQVRAHRAAVAETDGWDAIEGKVVMHLCDNPPCVRRDHLIIGTQRDNLADMWAKGRGRCGVRTGNAVLTPATVIEIRHEYAAGVSLHELAERFNTTPSNVWLVATRRTWKQVA